MISLLSQIPQQYSTVILLILIILAFIVAYRLMKMVFQTLMVTLLSGAFYVALVYFFSFSFSLNHLLFYAFLGSSLYIGFKFLASAYQIAETVISVPYKALKILFIPFKWIYGVISDKADTEKIKNLKNRKDKHSEDSSESSTKEVVVDKVVNKNKDDEDSN